MYIHIAYRGIFENYDFHNIYIYIEIYFRKVYGYVCIIVVDDTYTYNHLVGEMVLQQDHPGLHLMLIYFLYTVNRPRTF